MCSVMSAVVFVFFFKQKTAYEMRISDWSSDVCSSDLVVGPRYASSAPPPGATKEGYHRQHSAVEYLTEHFHEAPVWIVACIEHGKEIGRASCRERVCQYV